MKIIDFFVAVGAAFFPSNMNSEVYMFGKNGIYPPMIC